MLGAGSEKIKHPARLAEEGAAESAEEPELFINLELITFEREAAEALRNLDFSKGPGHRRGRNSFQTDLGRLDIEKTLIGGKWEAVPVDAVGKLDVSRVKACELNFEEKVPGQSLVASFMAAVVAHSWMAESGRGGRMVVAVMLEDRSLDTSYRQESPGMLASYVQGDTRQNLGLATTSWEVGLNINFERTEILVRLAESGCMEVPPDMGSFEDIHQSTVLL